MLSFASDYTQGAHPRLLDALRRINGTPFPGYGTDGLSAAAADKIRAYFGLDQTAQVYFLSGGTQTNQVVISSLLRSYEGVVAAETGHVASHEAGAIEFSGHKVLPLPAHEGKLNADDLRALITRFYGDGNYEHMVFPGMVYLSYPTEYGTLYTADELRAIHAVCREYGIPLYIDGARLAYGLMSDACDLSPAQLARLCDVFYAGGTKCGALFGEALIFPHGGAPEHYITVIKQHGALLAKGFVLGAQFDALFTDGLYSELGRRGIETAKRLKQALYDKGYRFYLDTPTNQQFVILENDQMRALAEKVSFGFWEPYDETHTVVRFATGWATTDEDVEQLRELL